MFGSTSPFGQSSNSPFASQSVFGQTNNTNNNPYAPNPSFGSVTPFGSQTGGSIFGGTSTGVFGAAQSSSPFSSTTAFGTSSSSAFGSYTPAFGSSSTPAFGSSSSSFGGSSVFGQKPAFGFGSTTTQSSPFGSTTQQSQPAFGSGIFGSSVPFGSTQSAFGATSTPAFGATSTPAFGATSTPAFGATSTPAFGATSTPAFGATSTPAFGATSTPSFGATSTPSFGATSTPAFGSASTPAFGSTSTPAFGSTGSPAFGSTGTAFGVSNAPVFGTGSTFGAPSTPAFGASSTPSFSFGSAFGQSTPAVGSFGATSTSAFGSSSTPAFGFTSTPAFGATSTPAFGSTGSPAFGSSGIAFGTPNTSIFGTGGTFGAPSTPAFGASSTPSFSFGSSPSFGQSTPAFGNSPFGTTAFGAQSSPFGSQSSAPAFGSTSIGQSTFGGQRGGSRVAPYTPTTEADGGSGTQAAGKLESISAMPVYKDKSHEELRWEDYQSGDKGGSNPAAGIGFGASTTPSNPFGSSSTFGQTSANPFSSTSTNPFGLKSPSFNSMGFTTLATTSNPFQSTSSSLFVPTSSMTTSIFGSSSTPTFGTGSSVTPSFSTSPSIFGTGVAPATAPTFATGLNFSGSQTSSLFSSTPAIGQTGNAFGQATSTFGQNTTNFGQTSIFNTPSTAFSGNMFSSYPSLAPSSSPAPFGQTTPSFSSPFQPAQTSGAFSFSNFGQTQSGGGSSIFGQSNIGLSSATQNAAVAQPSTITNPYGTLPAMPQMSIGRTGAAPSVQYGISSMPVVDKPAPVRISPLLTSRYHSQRRIRLPARKYYPDKDSPKVPFFSDDEETPSVPKADAIIFPRENPRSLVIRPTANWPSRASAERRSPLKDASSPVHENGKISDDGYKAEDKDENPAENAHVKLRIHPVKGNQKANGVQDDHSVDKEDSYKRIGGHRASEAAIVYEHGADIEALMPKLIRSDYFTEPRIQELAAKERAEPGYCRRVKDFVVGRHGYGSIKFLGETDVRRLDLESLVQFNNREVIVYLDDSKKPPVGQGLNRPAEVTLLNIKCFDKKTSEQYSEGPRVERYKNMLKRKVEEQGAEFLSYDPIKGEWKFKVNHFSSYKLEDDNKDHL